MIRNYTRSISELHSQTFGIALAEVKRMLKAALKIAMISELHSHFSELHSQKGNSLCKHYQNL